MLPSDRTLLVSCLCTFMVPPLAQAQSIWFVDSQSQGQQTGQSWKDAFTDLQDALRQARGGDQIWVASGVYRPDGGTRERSRSFRILSDIEIYGGFSGNEESLDERAGWYDQTILTGDLLGNDGDRFANRSDNAYHVISAEQVHNIVLDGFVVEGGHANRSETGPDSQGGGISLSMDGSLQIRHCLIRDNWAYYGAGIIINALPENELFIEDSRWVDNLADRIGGAIFLAGGKSQILRCTLTDNRSGSGGGISITGCQAALVRCHLDRNIATFGGAIQLVSGTVDVLRSDFNENEAAKGGAIYVDLYAAATVVESNFNHNSASYGGAIYHYANTASFLDHCNFNANLADRDGGAVYNYDGGSKYRGCSFIFNACDNMGGAIFLYRGSPQFRSCLLTANRAEVFGGAVCNYSSQLPEIIGSTLYGNQAGLICGGYYHGGSRTNISNTIFWENHDRLGNTESSQLGNYGSNLSINYSCVQGWTGTLRGTGNVGTEPMFKDPVGPDGQPGTGDENLKLDRLSPLIDSGDPYFIQDGENEKDARNHDRVIDGNNNRQAIIDMGAYEHKSKWDVIPKQ